MKNNLFKVSALFCAGLLTMSLSAQDKPSKQFGKQTELIPCGTTQYQQMLEQKYPGSTDSQRFEKWIAKKIAASKNHKNNLDEPNVVTIPVVVHVIHNGDAVGVNENIPEAQILSQIEVLNQDFRRMAGTPGFNENPVGADMEIQFCLAKRTPDGQNSTGITRHLMDVNDGWSMEQASEVLKPATQWDPEQYLNIWVVDWVYIEFAGFKSELAGFSTFPMQAGLDGLDDPDIPDTQTVPDQDGVVIGHRYFGSKAIFPEGTYDELNGRANGRTASHEIGHFFGLRHTWGDGDCSLDDFCDDTPVTAGANQVCAENDSCPANEGMDMIENYMDYTPDVCLNTFTQDQKARTQAVLQNSPRRANLATSSACSPAQVFDNDGALYINKLNLADCGNIFMPEIKLTNNGNTTLTAATIIYKVDNGTQVYFNWSGSLGQDESETILLPQMSAPTGTHTFNVDITDVNGSDDAYAENDFKTAGFNIIANSETTDVIVTIQLDSYGSETYWGIIDDSDNIITSGGGYEDSLSEDEIGELIVENVTLQTGQCYTFFVLDLMSDGMCCDYGNGYYTVADANGNVLISGGEFGQYETSHFGIDVTMATDTPSLTTQANILLYPNPANSIINIAVPQALQMPKGYIVYNNVGQVVDRGNMDDYNKQIDISGYANGIYFIKIDTQSGAKTLQFIKS